MPSIQASKKTVQMIKFETKLFTIGAWTILLLPESASAKLPIRGQTMVEGSINGYHIKTPLEPDGRWSHWLRLDGHLLKAIQAAAGDSVSVVLSPIKDWTEPNVPADIQRAIDADAQVRKLWENITPLARWEWIRSIRATNRQETRDRRIEVACSKMRAGERRPCCWNRNLCTEPSVSKNGVLLAP
jgi:hypothetical protein